MRLYLQAKQLGYLGQHHRAPFRTASCRQPAACRVYKMVDTCAAEFDAETPYFYSTFDEENEAAEFIAEHGNGKKR